MLLPHLPFTENLMYIEQVKFIAPYTVQLVGGDDQRLDTFLQQQKGILDKDAIEKLIRTISHPNDRTITTPSINLGGDTLYPCGQVPPGGIILWSGAIVDIPECWALCDGNNGTPDLTDRFIAGAGGGFNPDDTGGTAFAAGEVTISINHSHSSGTLATDSDNHSHTSGTLDTDNDTHSHTSGTLDTDNDSHSHTADGTLAAASDSHSHGTGTLVMGNENNNVIVDRGAINNENVTNNAHQHTISGSTASDAHTHDVTGNTNNDTHDHAVNAGSTANDTHDHAVNAGSTDSDSHSHNVDSGTTATGGGNENITPPFYALAYIMRTE